MALLFLIVLFVICVGGGYLISVTLFDFFVKTSKKPTIHTHTHHHYYNTENHLHITKDDFKNLIDTSHNQSP